MDIGTVEDHKRQSVLYKGQDNVLDIKDTEKPAVSKNIAPVSANAASYGPRPKTPLHQDTKNERLDKILSLFKPGEELMIKDIATHLKDVSEKTVQRELLLLVAKGSLRKKGERRWSRYTLK
jgi:hypothetical protein